jgi:F-type H+-transporting ATPase subunit b
MLDIDFVTILAQILNFLVLAAALYFLFFKIIIKRMNERAAEKEAAMARTKANEMQAEEKLSQIEQRLSNIDSEIESRLEEAYQKAQVERESLLEVTQAEAKRILSEAEHEAAKRQQQEMEDFEDKLVDTILEISAEILRKTTPDIVHENLVEDLNSEIWDLGKSDMRQVRTIRESLTESIPTVYITSAKELTPEQQRSLIRTFSALADSNVNMEIEVEPELIAGIHVRIGDLVVENTLAMELTELKSTVATTLEESADAKE